MKIRVRFLIMILFLVFLVGCTSTNSQNQVEELKQENSKLLEEVGNLTESNASYEQQVNKLSQQIEELELDENKVIIPKKLDLEVLKVMLIYFEGAKENDDEKIRSTIKLDSWNKDGLIAWGKRNLKKSGLIKVIDFEQDDVGRPRYIINFSYGTEGNMIVTFVFQKFDNSWKIVSID